jgi:uroporphyrin-III C-methyltransferase
MSGKVYFVGAGPGDPELLTRKAWTALRAAQVVLHDALVPRAILEVAPRGATLVDVGKRCGQKSITQEEIHAMLIGHARAGTNVVRLQGGDPLIFGRAGEEIAALDSAGIDFEIVPGVTAASAAAAAARVPLTDRRVASKLIFLSAHRRSAEPDAEERTAAATDATYAVYMPGGGYERIARELIDAGVPPDTPCVIVSQASTEGQSILRLDLGSLPQAPPVPAPALLIVGSVVGSAGRAVANAEAAGGVEAIPAGR